MTATHSVGELFCGPGGLALGAKLASESSSALKLRHSWVSDFDSDSCETIRQNLPADSELQILNTDVRDLDIENLPRIDGFAFGFPCNDYSRVGEQKGLAGKYGPLYSHGINVLRAKTPQWFIAENVSGLQSSQSGQVFRQILAEMAALDYEVTPHLYKFEEYGVPQNRHRIIVVGIHRDLKQKFEAPAPEHRFLKKTAREALSNPPIPGNAPNHEFSKVSRRVESRLRHILPGKNAFNSDLPSDLELNVTGATLSQIYKRLDPDKPAYTVTGSGGGGTYMYHWEDPRPLTNRERARLQTFPDTYAFFGNMGSVRKQIGMAVPVLASQILHEAVIKTLAGQEYQTVRPNLSHFIDQVTLSGV